MVGVDGSLWELWELMRTMGTMGAFPPINSHSLPSAPIHSHPPIHSHHFLQFSSRQLRRACDICSLMPPCVRKSRLYFAIRPFNS